MASILDYRTLTAAVASYKEEHEISKNTEALLRLVMELHVGVDSGDLSDAIIDASGDRGIDAIYIKSEVAERPIVYLFQSKYYENEEKFDRFLEAAALVKMQDALSTLILRSPREVRANRFLKDKLNDIKSLSNPRFKIIFCSNSQKPNKEASNEFQDFLDLKQESGLKFFEVEYLGLDEIVDLVTPETRREINSKLRLSGKYFDSSISGVRLLVGRLSCSQLAELRNREGAEIFDKNVRGYLSRKNPINERIYDSVTSEIEAHRFFILNNGLTIVCKNIDYLPVDESPELELKDLQVVNGGQTTNAIHEAYQSGRLSPSAYVLVRIVQTEDRKLLNLIAETTNSQTRVSARDLHSNDAIQRKIEAILRERGYYYETRKDKYKSEPYARGKRIDMEVAAQAYYACFHEQPANAKNKKRELFGSLYDEIFFEDMQPDDLLVAFKMLQYLRSLHSEFREDYSFVKYSELHSLAMLHRLGLTSLVQLEDIETRKVYEKILKATDEVVKEDVEKMGEDYSHRVLFIDPATIGRIAESFGDKFGQ